MENESEKMKERKEEANSNNSLKRRLKEQINSEEGGFGFHFMRNEPHIVRERMKRSNCCNP